MKKLALYIDAATGKQITASGQPIVRMDELPRLLLSEKVVLCFRFLTVTESAGSFTTAAHPLAADSAFAAFGDCDYQANTSLMVYSDGDKIDRVGDWLDGTTANPEAGQLSVLVDTKNARFLEALAASGEKSFTYVIEEIPAGSTDRVVLAKIDLLAENRPLCDNTALPVPTPDDVYPTRAEMLAETGAKLSSAHATDETAHSALFAAKAEASHTHTQAEVSGLPEALTAKEAAGTAAGLLANHAAASDAHSALFDAKAAVDLANLTAAGKDIIAKLVAPDLSRGTNFAAATIYGPTTKDGIIVATGGGTIMSIYCKNSAGAVYYASSSQWWAWLIIPRGTYYSGDVAGFFYPLKGTLA